MVSSYTRGQIASATAAARFNVFSPIWQKMYLLYASDRKKSSSLNICSLTSKSAVSFGVCSHLGLLCWDWVSHVDIEDQLAPQSLHVVLNLCKQSSISTCETFCQKLGWKYQTWPQQSAPTYRRSPPYAIFQHHRTEKYSLAMCSYFGQFCCFDANLRTLFR